MKADMRCCGEDSVARPKLWVEGSPVGVATGADDAADGVGEGSGVPIGALRGVSAGASMVHSIAGAGGDVPSGVPPGVDGGAYDSADGNSACWQQLVSSESTGIDGMDGTVGIGAGCWSCCGSGIAAGMAGMAGGGTGCCICAILDVSIPDMPNQVCIC